jgi:ATP-dependent exoDNAse (exonuclease V) beta subunit
MTEHGAPIPDLAARATALDPATSFIVQAPAGSGKTTLLTQRYLTLLSRVPRPEAVIAITFTQKAAAEMRERVLSALGRASAGAPAMDDADATTLRCAGLALARARDLGWSLVEQPSRLRIQTIDSLSHWLAERLPILSRAGASLAVEPRALPLYRLAAERTLAALDEPGALGDALAVVLGHLGNEAERLATLVSDMLAGRDRWLRIVVANGAADLRPLLEDSLGYLVASALARGREGLPDELAATMPPLVRAAAARLAPEDAAWQQLADAAPWPWPVDAASLPLWQRFASLCLTQAGGWRKTVNKNQGFPADDKSQKAQKAAFVDLLARLAPVPGLQDALAHVLALPPARFGDEEWRVVDALNSVLLAAATELVAVFAEEGVVDFPAVSGAALESLGSADEPTDLTIALDGRIEHLLVDEFQDTSAAQVELLKRLTGGWSTGDGRTLFLVGDPMQSIYLFREANVGLFLQIRAHGLGEVRLQPLTLEANFRSRPEVVDWINATFEPVLPARDAPDLGAVRYSRSLSPRAGDGAAGVRFSVLVEASAAAEAAHVAALVAGEQRASAGARIAVLGRSRAQLTQVAAALGAAGIRYQGVDLVPLAERPAIRDLVALTRALLHPADRAAWLACLRAPWCGLELGELEILAAGDEAPLPAQLADAQRLARLGDEARARLRRTLEVLTAARAERGRRPLGAWIEAAWLALGGPATLAAEADLADVRAFLGRLDLLAHAADLDDPPSLEDALEDLYAAPDPDAPATLQLLTIHKAKGLEWDVVILPGLGRGVRGQSRRLLEFFEFARDDDRAGLLLAPHLSRSREREPLEAWLRDLWSERTALELGRLLYVACTRARERLHLVTHLGCDADGLPAPPRRGSLLATLWPGVGAQVLARADASAAPAAVEALATRVSQLRRLPAAWAAPPAEPAVVPLPAPMAGAGPTEFEFEWVTNVARHVGTVVHEEFERLAGAALPAGSGPEGRDAAWSRRLAELGVGEQQRGAALERVRRALEATSRDPRGAWVLDPAHLHGASELDLSTLSLGRVQSARIDRTFVDGAGVRWIVDFKTSVHEGTDLEGFLDRERERYRGQLEHYAVLMAAFDPGRPIRLGLYFPLHAGWREWAAGEAPPG